VGDGLQLFQTFQVQFGSLTAGTRTGSTESIADIDENIVERFRFDLAVVSRNRMNDIFGFIVFTQDIRTDLLKCFSAL
jgi:hypothetical protein